MTGFAFRTAIWNLLSPGVKKEWMTDDEQIKKETIWKARGEDLSSRRLGRGTEAFSCNQIELPVESGNSFGARAIFIEFR
jgi:hypothetical protein